jgi:hypothetical protein
MKERSLIAIQFHERSSGLKRRMSLTILTGELRETTVSQAGCPWDITDGYKSSWDIPLCHIDSFSSLRFYDYKGKVRACL